ncbi:MAG: elongation factor G [Candidatus Krumholzibacteria bacterium]|nr:elongation factor G [Candidatus Krumholzibacteria bacterium]
MKQYAPDKIRNIALVGHQDTGKTSLAEVILFSTGAVSRVGRVEDGNTTMDTAPEEIERKISILAALAFCEFDNHKINLVDTPGYEDFVGEVFAGLDVVEGAVLVIRGDAGAEVGTEKIWRHLRDNNVPTVVCINKMDKENASFDSSMKSLQDNLGGRLLAMQYPLGEGHEFKGIIDVIDQKAYEYKTDGKGDFKTVEIPGDVAEKVASMRREIYETAAENDEALMEKYIETDSLTLQEAIKGISIGVAAGDVFPVFLASAETNIGIPQLLGGIAATLPSPVEKPLRLGDGDDALSPDPSGPTAAKIFKNVSESHVGDMLFVRNYRGTLSSGKDIFNGTREHAERLGQLFFLQGRHRTETDKITAGDIGAAVKLKNAHVGDTLCDKSKPVKIPQTVYPTPSIFSAISAASKGDEDKIGTGLNRLKEEDPTFDVRVDTEVHQTLISGQGELHLEILVGRLKSRYGVEVLLSKPRIPYKETIKKSAQAQGKYKKQTGGRGQYGDVWLKLEPLPRGGDFEFVNAIVGGVVPGKFIPAVEKGVVATLREGVVAGYPVVDVKTTLYDGSYHNVDSSEQAFKVAGSMAFKKAAMEANIVLLEPIMNVEVKVPEDFMGDVMGDLSSRRGKIQGMDPEGHFNVIKAQVPLAELYRYSTHLRSMTQGRGIHKREFSHYEEVPRENALKIIEEAKKQKEEAQQG